MRVITEIYTDTAALSAFSALWSVENADNAENASDSVVFLFTVRYNLGTFSPIYTLHAEPNQNP